MPARKALNMDTFEGKLAHRLYELREKSGLTQEQVAEKCSVSEKRSVSKNMVFQWENGRSLPPLRRLPMIAKIYGVKVRDLMPEDF